MKKYSFEYKGLPSEDKVDYMGLMHMIAKYAYLKEKYNEVRNSGKYDLSLERRYEDDITDVWDALCTVASKINWEDVNRNLHE